jgi:hypothetical protein
MNIIILTGELVILLAAFFAAGMMPFTKKVESPGLLDALLLLCTGITTYVSLMGAKGLDMGTMPLIIFTAIIFISFYVAGKLIEAKRRPLGLALATITILGGSLLTNASYLLNDQLNGDYEIVMLGRMENGAKDGIQSIDNKTQDLKKSLEGLESSDAKFFDLVEEGYSKGNSWGPLSKTAADYLPRFGSKAGETHFQIHGLSLAKKEIQSFIDLKKDTMEYDEVLELYGEMVSKPIAYNLPVDGQYNIQVIGKVEGTNTVKPLSGMSYSTSGTNLGTRGDYVYLPVLQTSYNKFGLLIKLCLENLSIVLIALLLDLIILIILAIKSPKEGTSLSSSLGLMSMLSLLVIVISFVATILGLANIEATMMEWITTISGILVLMFGAQLIASRLFHHGWIYIAVLCMYCVGSYFFSLRTNVAGFSKSIYEAALSEEVAKKYAGLHKSSSELANKRSIQLSEMRVEFLDTTIIPRTEQLADIIKYTTVKNPKSYGIEGYTWKDTLSAGAPNEWKAWEKAWNDHQSMWNAERDELNGIMNIPPVDEVTVKNYYDYEKAFTSHSKKYNLGLEWGDKTDRGEVLARASREQLMKVTVSVLLDLMGLIFILIYVAIKRRVENPTGY